MVEAKSNRKMTQDTSNPGNRLGIVAELARNAQLVWRLLCDRRVSLPTKLIIPGVIGLYLLSPVDAMPDLLPLLGQLDDIAVLMIGVALFIEMAPRYVVEEHRAALLREATGRAAPDVESETVDAEYRVIE